VPSCMTTRRLWEAQRVRKLQYMKRKHHRDVTEQTNAAKNRGLVAASYTECLDISDVHGANLEEEWYDLGPPSISKLDQILQLRDLGIFT
jgi:hypothetical protein